MEQYGLYDIDHNKLVKLGFYNEEINLFTQMVQSNVKPTINNLLVTGLNYDQARRIVYMRDICMGKVMVEDIESFVKHLKKMNPNAKKIGIQDLAISNVGKVPRIAVVSGIKDETFSVFNSRQEEGLNMFYKVLKTGSTNIVVETTRRPVLKYKQSKTLDGVLSIDEVKDNKLTVTFNKQYCKLLNRFVIVASFRRPEFHLGLIQMVCPDGTRIYVYGQDIGTKEKASYNMSNQRVYAYGFFPNEITGKLRVVAHGLTQMLQGVLLEEMKANCQFVSLPKDIVEDDEDNVEIED